LLATIFMNNPALTPYQCEIDQCQFDGESSATGSASAEQSLFAEQDTLAKPKPVAHQGFIFAGTLNMYSSTELNLNVREIKTLLTETDRRLAGASVSGAGKKGNRSKQRKTERRRKCRELIHFSYLGFLCFLL